MRIKGSPRKGCKCYMRRWDIIQGLINKNKYKRYLEIGIWDITANFEKISCPFKVCVDPNPQLGDVTFRGTSDAYFEQLHPEFKYDMVFVDGLHIHEQTTKDIYNSFKHLNDGGMVIVHDCLPHNKEMQSREDNGTLWTGDVWKSIAKIRMEDTSIVLDVVDTDFGCGILQKGNSQLYPKVDDTKLTFDFFQRNRKELMNVISPDEFIKKYLK